MNLLGPRLYFVPIAVAFVLVEIFLLHRDRSRGEPRFTGFDWRDTISGPMVGAAAQIIGLVNRFLLVAITGLYLPVALPPIRNPFVDYLVAIVAWDFAFYWFHRLSHRTALGWASHITHHESPYFNLTTALRLEWFPIIGLLTYPPLALLGLSNGAMASAVLINGFYGGVIHTELIPRLPKPIEWLFNTPWHHRVHHRRATLGGANFANTFVVWDRLFGTFAEVEPNQGPYGVPCPSPYGPLRTPLHRFVTIFLRPTAAKVRALGGRPARAADEPERSDSLGILMLTTTSPASHES